ncbi:hypothetical protein RRG08_053649 [Elysia crispata]|uniref:Uncharacterized protein n=1 Tax=Elysia crispata TaxID=231223 RepID=A0AAE1DR39_9GAST|nr:hypothetical protein RRG08_053649 [Elysia crispata]
MGIDCFVERVRNPEDCQTNFRHVVDQTTNFDEWCSAAQSYADCINGLTRLSSSHKEMYIGNKRLWAHGVFLDCDF